MKHEMITHLLMRAEKLRMRGKQMMRQLSFGEFFTFYRLETKATSNTKIKERLVEIG